ncbi:hypothetical protein QFC21_006480 [Naganishia friedmannii]|uniref:Uncharacterized protein n=1 Tax=Naganishia friedmannii TaxID=89922 RepID=A0ACC2V2C0_9TREE|nr:hypothetical protein QFC21_006480 [Naganishia friedmannii]
MEDQNLISSTNNERTQQPPQQQNSSSTEQPAVKRRRTRLEASCERSKPANRTRKARSVSSTESISNGQGHNQNRNRKSKTPSTNATIVTTKTNPKLYPIGDGTWAPLEYVLSLRAGFGHGQGSSGSQRHHQNQDQVQDQIQSLNQDTTSAERGKSSSVPRNLEISNNGGHHHIHQSNNEHDSHQQQRPQEYQKRHSTSSFVDDRAPDHVASSFAVYENTGGFGFPISTARLHGGGGCGVDGSGNGGGEGMHERDTYRSLSSRLDATLFPLIDPANQQRQTGTHAELQQQHSNTRHPMSSSTIGGSLQLPALQGNTTNGRMMMEETSLQLQHMNAAVRPDTLRSHQHHHQPPQDPTSNLYLSYNSFPSPSRGQDNVNDQHNHHRAPTSELAFTPPEEMGLGLSRILSPATDPYEPSLPPRDDRREHDYLIHSQDHRKKFLGASSSQVFVKWLDEESSSGMRRPSSHLKHGMTAAEEMVLPGQLELCHHPLPPQPALETYVSTYFRTFHILYPVLDEIWLRSQLIRRQKGPQQAAGEDFVAPVVYLVVSLGASMTPTAASNHQSVSAVSRTYLDLAWKALSVILGRPFRSSVQALVLMAVALRLSELARVLVYIAIPLDPKQASTREYESGRPMTIRRSDYSTSLASFKDDTFTLGTNLQPVNVLAALAELCQEIAYMIQVLFPTNPAASPEYEIEVLEHIGVIHMRLETWAKSLPLQIRPGGDTPVPGPFFPFAAMLHMQYHQMLSLIDHPRLVLQNLTHPLLRDRPFLHYLEASESICTQSARAILTTLDASARTPARYHHWTFHSIGTAIFALSLFTCKHPTTWRARADVEMLSHATREITKGFLDQGLSPQFVDMYEAVNRMTRKKVMESFEPEPLVSHTEESLHPPMPEPTMDQTAVSIDELWSTLFGLGNITGNEIPHSRNDPSYRF